MNHQELKNFILETYPASADHPWLQYPNYEVFRHNSNQKWFAVVMELPKSKLGLQGEERMDVVNLKCDPILTGSLLTEKGFFPAYHMRKDSWITAALDGTVPTWSPCGAEPMSGTGQRITFTAISMKRKSCSEMGTL